MLQIFSDAQTGALMKKITLISGHPNLAISVGNQTILNELSAHFGDN